MSYQDNGGHAFPIEGADHPDGRHFASYGMTLRDYFAARAMQSFLASPHNVGTAGPEDIANAAYCAADAMLEARKAS